MASIRKHHGQWYVIYRDPHAQKPSPIWEPCGKRRELAEKRKRQVEQTLANGDSPSVERLDFAEAWQRWMQLANLSNTTRADYESMYRVHFEPFFVDDNIRIKRITATTIDEFILDRREHGTNRYGKPTGISDGRLSRLLIVLKAFLYWCKSRGYTGEEPNKNWFSMPKTIPRKVQPLTLAQVEALITATPPNYRAFVAFLAYSGARLSEATAVRWEDFDAEIREVWIRRKWEGDESKDYTKTDSDRHAPIIPRLRELLCDWRAECGDPKEGWTFVQPSGNLIDKNNFRARVFRIALARAGLDETFRIHDLRHTCASQMHASGTMPRDVMEALGWTQMGTMLRYTHNTDNSDQISDRMQAKWEAEINGDDCDTGKEHDGDDA